MPTNNSLNPSKKKIRPSSATAKLQTHPSYFSSLYGNNVRPSTAAPTSLSHGDRNTTQRPKTQAGGRKGLKYASQDQESEAQKLPQRRLTLSAVNGLDVDSDSTGARVQPAIGQHIKILGKVSLEL